MFDFLVMPSHLHWGNWPKSGNPDQRIQHAGSKTNKIIDWDMQCDLFGLKITTNYLTELSLKAGTPTLTIVPLLFVATFLECIPDF